MPKEFEKMGGFKKFEWSEINYSKVKKLIMYYN